MQQFLKLPNFIENIKLKFPKLLSDKSLYIHYMYKLYYACAYDKRVVGYIPNICSFRGYQII